MHQFHKVGFQVPCKNHSVITFGHDAHITCVQNCELHKIFTQKIVVLQMDIFGVKTFKHTNVNVFCYQSLGDRGTYNKTFLTELMSYSKYKQWSFI